MRTLSRLARIGIAGASLGIPRFDSIYGIAAFAAGRGLHALLALFPMLVGASIGLAIARRRRLLALVPTGLLTLAVIGLAVLVGVDPELRMRRYAPRGQDPEWAPIRERGGGH